MPTIEITEELLIACLNEATDAGSFSGSRQVKELAKDPASGKLLDSCGGSNLILNIDGRSKLGKLLSRLSLADINITKAYGGGFSISLPYKIKIISPVSGQEKSIYYAADSAAVKVIKNRLGIEAYASRYDS